MIGRFFAPKSLWSYTKVLGKSLWNREYYEKLDSFLDASVQKNQSYLDASREFSLQPWNKKESRLSACGSFSEIFDAIAYAIEGLPENEKKQQFFEAEVKTSAFALLLTLAFLDTDATISQWSVSKLKSLPVMTRHYEKLAELYLTDPNDPKGTVLTSAKRKQILEIMKFQTKDHRQLKTLEKILVQSPPEQRPMILAIFKDCFPYLKSDNETIQQVDRLKSQGYDLKTGQVSVKVEVTTNETQSERQHRIVDQLIHGLNFSIEQRKLKHGGTKGGNAFFAAENPAEATALLTYIFKIAEKLKNRPLIHQQLLKRDDLMAVDRAIYLHKQKEPDNPPVVLLELPPESSLSLQQKFWIYGTQFFDSPDLHDVNLYAAEQDTELYVGDVLYVMLFKKPDYRPEIPEHRSNAILFDSLFKTRTSFVEIEKI